MESSLIILLASLGFVAALFFSQRKYRSRRVNWIRLAMLIAGTIWMVVEMVAGTKSSVFTVLLAIMFASGAASVAWELWSETGQNERVR